MPGVLLFGGGGRVGLHIAGELLRRGHHVALVDILPHSLLQQRAARTYNDARLAAIWGVGSISLYADVNVLDRAIVESILATEQPELVINYAIPITWDATKRLPNYARVSRAGLGAFTPVQVCAPRVIGEAMANTGVSAHYMVCNLPDITVPVLCGYADNAPQARPLCGAGNVGLIETAVHTQVANETGTDASAITVSLVAHHIHWVAPREPGYLNDAPFLLKVTANSSDPRTGRMVIFQFPSAAAAEAWYNDPDYQAQV